MTEEINNAVSGTESQIDTNQDYISALNEMKKNTVSKEAYDKLRADNKKLLDTIVSGQSLEQTEVKEEVDVDALRKELFGKSRRDLSNLEYVDKALQLRKALMEKGEQDPFVMKAGPRSSPEPEDFKKAERVASVLQQCVDIADGNDSVFDNEFQRRLI